MGTIADNEVDANVHPIELTVQSLLDGPLETLNLNFESLQESQTILFNILHKLEASLTRASNNLRPGSFPSHEQIVSLSTSPKYASLGPINDDICTSDDGVRIDYSDVEGQFDLKSYLDRLLALRKKIKNIEMILDRVEKIICNIENAIKE